MKLCEKIKYFLVRFISNPRCQGISKYISWSKSKFISKFSLSQACDKCNMELNWDLKEASTDVIMCLDVWVMTC